jgi:uncharacterized protein (DUF2267 family)
MSSTGLDVFDKTLQTTHMLGAVLRAIRDRVPLGLALHLGSQLPLLVRGARAVFQILSRHVNFGQVEQRASGRYGRQEWAAGKSLKKFAKGADHEDC